MKLKENAFLWLSTGCGAIALVSAIDGNPGPDGFFVAVRVLVCFASAYAGVKAFQAKKEVLTWLLGASAALYNPFLLVHLTREIWNVADLVGSVLLVAAGIVLRVRDDVPTHPDKQDNDVAFAVDTQPKEKVYRTPSRTELSIWLALGFLVLAGAFMTQYSAYLDGTTQSVEQNRNVGTSTLGMAIWAYVIARFRKWRHPGRIALISFLVGIATLLAASMAGGYTKGTESKGIVASIERFDPALAARLKESKSSDSAQLIALMGSSLPRAIKQAPDAAVIAFMDERLSIIKNDSPGSVKRCVAAFNGAGGFQISPNEQRQLMRAFGDLYGAAADGRVATPEVEHAAAVVSLTAIYKKIDPLGVLDEVETRKALSELDQCSMYKRLMLELESLPPKERAAVFRVMAEG